MSMQITTFKQGEFRTYVSKRDFTLGDIGLKIQRGIELEYDGYTLIYKGSEYKTPQFRGTISPKIGWVTTPELFNEEEEVLRQPAGIQVRNANGGNPSNTQSRAPIIVSAAEDQVVADVSKHASITRARNNGRGFPFVDAGHTVEVKRGFATPAKQNTNDDDVSFGEAMRQADSVKIKPGQGKTRDQYIADLPPEQRAEYITKIATLTQSKGVETTVGSTPIFDMSGTDTPNEIVEYESEGIKFTNTNTRKPMVKVGTPVPVVSGGGDFRRKIALSVCADFPESYDFDAPVKKKLARLQADFDERPDVILAVAAAETDAEMKSLLVSEFPGAFS